MELEPDTEAWDMVSNLMRATVNDKLKWEMASYEYDGPLRTDLGRKKITLFKNRIEIWGDGEVHSWKNGGRSGMITDLYRVARSNTWEGKEGEEVAQEINSELESI